MSIKDRRRRRAQKFATTPGQVHPPGHELAGEPVGIPRGTVRARQREQRRALALAANAAAEGGLPLSAQKRAIVMGGGRGDPASAAEARALAMGWGQRDAAAKFHGMGMGGWDVPAGGTPDGLPELAGQLLPMVAASRQIEDLSGRFAPFYASGALIEPPYDPWELVVAVEDSSALTGPIDAMATNLTGYGYELTPLFPTEDKDGQKIDPPPEAVEERQRLELFLESANLECGLLGLMDRVDRDIEGLGWGCIEVLRNSERMEAAWEYVPAYTIRLAPLGKKVETTATVRHPSTGSLVKQPRWIAHRLYCQVRDADVVWFKSYGDPRHVNAATGEIRGEDEEPWTGPNNTSLEATELIFLRIHPMGGHTPYGVPRWIGAMPHVQAEREAGELIVDWFLNSPIGLKIALISGGRWDGDSLAMALADIDEGHRGADCAWGLTTLEGEAIGGSGATELDSSTDGVPRISFEDLTWEIPTELYHGTESLIDRSRRRAQAPWRMGAILYGDSEAESNRAAAETARAMAEEQVWGPTRKKRWGALLNRRTLPGMGINFWGFKLLGANAGDTDATFRGLGPFNDGGGTSPNSLIATFSTMTGSKADPIREPWGDRPLPLTLKLIDKGIDPNLPLSEIGAELTRRAEAAAAGAAAAAAGPVGNQDGDAGGGGSSGAVAEKAIGELGPEGRKALAVAVTRGLLELRGEVVKAMGAGEDIPGEWKEDG